MEPSDEDLVPLSEDEGEDNLAKEKKAANEGNELPCPEDVEGDSEGNCVEVNSDGSNGESNQGTEMWFGMVIRVMLGRITIILSTSLTRS